MPSMQTVYGNQVVAELVLSGKKPTNLDFVNIRIAAATYIDETRKEKIGIIPAFDFAAIVMATWPEWVNER